MAKLGPPYIPFMPLLLKGKGSLLQVGFGIAPRSPPFSGLSQDMTFINEGNPNYTEKLVNFEKMVSLPSGLFPDPRPIRARLISAFLQRMMARTVKVVRACRSQPYSESTRSVNTAAAESDGASFCPQRRRRPSGAWRTACSWKDPRCACPPVSSLLRTS